MLRLAQVFAKSVANVRRDLAKKSTLCWEDLRLEIKFKAHLHGLACLSTPIAAGKVMILNVCASGDEMDEG